MDPSENGRARPSETARRVAETISEMHGTLLDIEERVLGFVPSDRVRDPALLEALQSIDVLRQSAEGLATFVERWADVLPEGPGVDAGPLVEGLALRRLSDRFSGSRSDAPAGTPPAGEADFF